MMVGFEEVWFFGATMIKALDSLVVVIILGGFTELLTGDGVDRQGFLWGRCHQVINRDK